MKTEKLSNYLDAPFQWLYRLENTQWREDPTKAWDQSLSLMENIAQGKHLPPHQYASVFKDINARMHQHTLTNVKIDRIRSDGTSLYRSLVWQVGLDTERLSQEQLEKYLLQPNADGFGAIFHAIYDPREDHIRSFSFHGYNWQPERFFSEKAGCVSVKKGTWEIPDSELITRFIGFKGKPQQVNWKDNYQLGEVRDVAGWHRLYALTDTDKYRYFFTRNFTNRGEEQRENHTPDEDLNPGWDIAMPQNV